MLKKNLLIIIYFSLQSNLIANAWTTSQVIKLEQRVNALEKENIELKKRVALLEKNKGSNIVSRKSTCPTTCKCGPNCSCNPCKC